MSLVTELKRRKVFPVAIAYAVVGWLLIQVAVGIEAPLGLPAWFDTAVIVLILLGFPLALVLSWMFDFSAGGLVRAGEAGHADAHVARGTPAARPAEPPAPSARPVDDVLPHSVAVLPFENLSPNADDAYFAAGVHEEILNYLAKVGSLNVIARTSVLQYAGAARPIADIARELRVGAVMEGSVRYAGQRVRVTAQLIEGATGVHLWSETYDRDLADIFAIQTDIAKQIAAALRASLSGDERKRIEAAPTRSTTAYQLFLKALEIYLQAGDITTPASTPGVRASMQAYFDRAIAADPDFALAHAWKARLYYSTREAEPVRNGAWPQYREQMNQLIRFHAEKALAIDANNGLAHAVLGINHAVGRKLTEARRSLDHALSLSPNDSQVLFWAAVIQSNSDDPARAVELARRAAEIDPANPEPLTSWSYNLQQIGDLDAAYEVARAAVALAPNEPVSHTFLSNVQIASGDRDAAIATLRQMETLMPVVNAMSAHVGWRYGVLGMPDDARRIVEQIEAWGQEWYLDPATRGINCLALRDFDGACAQFRRVIEEPDSLQAIWRLYYVRTNSASDPVIREPRFRDLLDAWQASRG
jgi:adenylate cyclase